MKKADAIRLVQVDKTHQIHNDCDNLRLLNEITRGEFSGGWDFYTYLDCNEEPFFSRPIIKLSEITEEDNTERVIEVLSNDVWVSRVLVAFKKNKAVCWMDGETIEEAKETTATTAWKKWREVQPKVELTNDEFEKLVGCKFENFKIKE